MSRFLDFLPFVLITVGVWINQRQMDVIGYLWEENSVCSGNSSDAGDCISTTPAPPSGLSPRNN